MKRLLDYDPETKTTEYIHLDGTGKAVIESIQDCEPILEYNAQEAEFFDKKSDYWKVGTIPLSICFEWAKECGCKPFTKEWQEYAKKKMNDSNFSKLNPNRIRI